MPESPRWFSEALSQPYTQHEVVVEGCRVHYLHWGDVQRPGIVLVHGGAAHARWWGFTAPLLASEYRVAALDLSGHGESGRRPEYPRALWAREALAVARDAGFPGPPILVGHSMGGFVCIQAAADFGHELAGCVLIDSPVRRPNPEEEEGARGKAFRNPKVYPDLESALAHYRLVPEGDCAADYVLDYVARASVVETPEGWTWKFDPEVFRRSVPRAEGELLERVGCRVALMRAQYGLVTDDIHAYMYERLHRNAPVFTVPEAYHHLMMDQPLAFVAALRALLADWEHSVPRQRPASSEAS